MNRVVIDIVKFRALHKAFRAKEKEEGLSNGERDFYRGGIVALNQVLFDNGFLVEKKDERISEESSI